MNHYEGKAQFQLGEAFYNPKSRVVRDLGVLAALVCKKQQGQLRVLEVMAGSGIRSLRYYLESHADFLWVNEGNYQLNTLLKQNLQNTIPDERYQLTHLDAHRVFFDCFNHRDYYDLVDVDCFGTAAPYLNTMLWATRIDGLMYLTSTDGRTLAGRIPNKSLQAYGAYPRSHPALQEQALRLIIGSVAQQAGTKGLGAEPIFAFFSGKTYRVMFRLTRYTNLTSENYGFLGYCHQCGDYQTINWRKLGKAVCSHDNSAFTVSGAMWLGALHNKEYLSAMKAVAQQLQWQHIVKLLSTMIAEADLPPYFFTLREIGKRGKLDLPQRSLIIQALQNRGYQASATHINPEAIKTNADIHHCIAIVKELTI
ncbi:N2,N2-dimethylguanosine tRNA methyltransferase [Hyella patelloides LEGE 07179]|uniref:N2,N2-dimethylguanosine tRNA methyltransferase n=1 Tax=Hyella patelloides LEGE 07179 TaxID=945734 RepID=A0A563VZR7_9CYAN|nr:tRNA (guanine-N1)-methyltransferase [Hyella patelloides]VEP16885.1 N2,N2-dimethylguanosine tRNA methyltransferase [Hyella patelloides LEGE 07179]